MSEYEYEYDYEYDVTVPPGMHISRAVSGLMALCDAWDREIRAEFNGTPLVVTPYLRSHEIFENWHKARKEQQA